MKDWLIFIGVFGAMSGLLFLIFVLPVISKVQICRTYYSELPWYACIGSSYGLPPRETKK
jgi:hypothetical protein